MLLQPASLEDSHLEEISDLLKVALSGNLMKYRKIFVIAWCPVSALIRVLHSPAQFPSVSGTVNLKFFSVEWSSFNVNNIKRWTSGVKKKVEQQHHCC